MNIQDFIPLEKEMLAMAYHLGGTELNVKDIVQDSFLKLLEIQEREGNLDRIAFKGKPNKAYVYLIVRSCATNELRSVELQKKEAVAFLHNYSIRETLEETVDRHEYEESINDKLKAVHYFSRMVFEAYVLHDHSVRSLSNATKIGTQTIRNELKHVKAVIKKLTNDGNR
jgi:RNA polymerase sigma factor (sigma-70 family)